MKRIKEEKNYWNKNALDPDVDEKYIADVPTDLCLKDIGRLKGKVLEIGCGVGRLLGPETIGIDTSQNMVDIARKRGHEYVYRTDGRTIAFDDERFDVVYSYLVFQHLQPDAVKGYIEEAYRVLKKGGKLIFQFIEGDEREQFSNHYSIAEIEEMMSDFKDINFMGSHAYSGWTICEALK